MVDNAFKAVMVAEIALWCLAFTMANLGLARREDGAKVMAVTIGLLAATGMAWWVVSA